MWKNRGTIRRSTGPITACPTHLLRAALALGLLALPLAAQNIGRAAAPTSGTAYESEEQPLPAGIVVGFGANNYAYNPEVDLSVLGNGIGDVHAVRRPFDPIYNPQLNYSVAGATVSPFAVGDSRPNRASIAPPSSSFGAVPGKAPSQQQASPASLSSFIGRSEQKGSQGSQGSSGAQSKLAVPGSFGAQSGIGSPSAFGAQEHGAAQSSTGSSASLRPETPNSVSASATSASSHHSAGHANTGMRALLQETPSAHLGSGQHSAASSLLSSANSSNFSSLNSSLGGHASRDPSSSTSAAGPSNGAAARGSSLRASLQHSDSAGSGPSSSSHGLLHSDTESTGRAFSGGSRTLAGVSGSRHTLASSQKKSALLKTQAAGGMFAHSK